MNSSDGTGAPDATVAPGTSTAADGGDPPRNTATPQHDDTPDDGSSQQPPDDRSSQEPNDDGSSQKQPPDDLASAPDILARFEEAIAASGLVGEVKQACLIFL